MIGLDSSKMLAEWTIGTGFSSFDIGVFGEIDVKIDYLTEAQVNYIRNKTKEISYHNEFNRLKRIGDSRSLSALQRPVLDEPNELNYISQNVADFLQDLGKKLEKASAEITRALGNVYARLDFDLREIGTKKSALAMIKEIEDLITQFAEREEDVLGESRINLAEIGSECKQIIDCLKDGISSESNIYLNVEEVALFVELFFKKLGSSPVVQGSLSLSLQKLNDIISAFKEGESTQQDLIKSIEEVEAVVASYNRKGWMFRFNPISTIGIDVNRDGRKNKTPLLDAIVEVITPLKLNIGCKSHLLRQFTVVNSVILRFDSISNVVLQSYSFAGRKLIGEMSDRVSLIRNRIGSQSLFFCAKAALGCAIELFSKKISSEILLKKDEITGVFLRHLVIDRLNKSPWKEWNPRQYLLCEEVKFKERSGSDRLSEFGELEVPFQIDDIMAPAAKETTIPATPIAIADLNLSRPSSSIIRQDSVVTVQELPLFGKGFCAVQQGVDERGPSATRTLNKPIAKRTPVEYKGLDYYMNSGNVSTEVVTLQAGATTQNEMTQAGATTPQEDSAWVSVSSEEKDLSFASDQGFLGEMD